MQFHFLEGCVLCFFRLDINEEMKASKEQRDITQILTNTVRNNSRINSFPSGLVALEGDGGGGGGGRVQKCSLLEAIQMPTIGRVVK